MYPEDDWIRFADVLQNDVSVFSSSDRTSLINDAFALAASGRLKYSQALNLTLYLGSKERCSSSWQTAFLAIDNIADILYFNPMYAKLVSYLSDLLKKPYEELGWSFQSQDSLEQIKLRTLILKKMCTYGSDASAKAGEMLLDWKNTGNKIDPNLREIVYRFGMKKVGDMGVWKWMLEKYRNESNAQEKQKLLLGLTSVSEPWILSHFLYLAEDSRYVFSVTSSIYDLQNCIFFHCLFAALCAVKITLFYSLTWLGIQWDNLLFGTMFEKTGPNSLIDLHSMIDTWGR